MASIFADSTSEVDCAKWHIEVGRSFGCLIMVRTGNSLLYDINRSRLELYPDGLFFPGSKCSAVGCGKVHAPINAVSQGKEAERDGLLILHARPTRPESKTESCFCG